MFLILIVLTSILLKGQKFIQSQFTLIFHAGNCSQKSLEMCKVDI